MGSLLSRTFAPDRLGAEPSNVSSSGDTRLPLSELRIDRVFRQGGVDANHVAVLSDLDGRWPPILVNREHAVIDGAHRFHAAKRLGLRDIACEYFDGSPEDAALEFVLRNVRQGLPLRLSQREEGASELLDLHGDWSDRRIATSCGLSPRTVAAIRRAQGTDSTSRPDAQSAHVDKRLGTDNKLWPIDRSAIEQRVKEAIQNNPGMSLRRIADEAQVSPETVRRAKARFQAPPAAEAVIKGQERPASATPLGAYVSQIGNDEHWRADRALCSMPSPDFVDWFQRTSVGDEWETYVSLVPLSRVYEIADEARRRARLWAEFACALEGRTSKETCRTEAASGGEVRVGALDQDEPGMEQSKRST